MLPHMEKHLSRLGQRVAHVRASTKAAPMSVVCSAKSSLSPSQPLMRQSWDLHWLCKWGGALACVLVPEQMNPGKVDSSKARKINTLHGYMNSSLPELLLIAQLHHIRPFQAFAH